LFNFLLIQSEYGNASYFCKTGKLTKFVANGCQGKIIRALALSCPVFIYLFYIFGGHIYTDCGDIPFRVSWKVMPLCCWVDFYLSAMCPMRLTYKEKHYPQMV